MKQDIFATADKPKKDIVIFEINDTGREHEYRAGHGYNDAFVSFLESLGFEPTRKYEHSSNVELNGIEFGINTGNASYMSKNAYTRNTYVRKPANRWIGLEKFGGIVVRVYINKEMDAAKIKQQINRAIGESNKRDQDIEDRKAQDKKNTIAIGEHYANCKLVKKHCSTVYIEKGTISFHLKGYASIKIKSDGSFLKFSLYLSDVETISEIPVVAHIVEGEMKVVADIAKEVTAFKKLSADLQEWTVTAYHIRYDVQKKKLFDY